MSVEYYQNEEDPSIKIREEIRRNPRIIRGLLQTAQVENPNLSEHDFLVDLGFDDTETTNFLARGF